MSFLEPFGEHSSCSLPLFSMPALLVGYKIFTATSNQIHPFALFPVKEVCEVLTGKLRLLGTLLLPVFVQLLFLKTLVNRKGSR